MESTGTTPPLRFGTFELDVRLRELRTGTTRIRLQEQPFEILRIMLERPGDIVTREQLRQRLWPQGTYVDFEHSLNAAVKRLRAALGDDAENPRFVETLPRRGYRFIAPLNRAEPPARSCPSPATASCQSQRAAPPTGPTATIAARLQFWPPELDLPAQAARCRSMRHPGGRPEAR